MPATIIQGPAASGKTETCLARIIQQQREAPLSTVWAIAPDRLQTSYLRRRLALHGGVFGVSVGTFGELYRELLRLAGRPIPLASDQVIHRLIRRALLEVRKDGGLQHFLAIADKPGFQQILLDRILELKYAQIRPEALSALGQDGHSAQTARRPAFEIGAIYHRYQQELQRLGWADDPGLNWLSCEALVELPDLARSWSLVVVDGFDSFNQSQLKAMALLGERIPQLLITLPGSESARRAQRRFNRARAEILAAIENVTIEAPGPRISGSRTPQAPAALEKLEKLLFVEQAPRFSAGAAIKMLELRSPGEEAREALRWIKSLNVRSRIALREMALVTPDPERYRRHLREAGREFGIPLQFTIGLSTSSAAPVAALLNLLALDLRGWPRRMTLQVLRSPYFEVAAFGFDQRAIAALDDVSLKAQVTEGLEQWKEALDRLAGGAALLAAAEDEDQALPHLPRGEQAGALWESLRLLSERIQPGLERMLAEWVEWLEDLLDDLRFFPACESITGDQAAASSLRETLRELVLAEAVSGGETLGYADFYRLLKRALDSAFFQEPTDLGRDAVPVLRLLEARGIRYQALGLLGLAEGVFPQIEKEDPFFAEDLRHQLGLEPRLGREQGGLLYQVLTRADRWLLLTRPYLAEDGETWEPSPFWKACADLLTDPPQRIRPDQPRALSEAASAEELLFWAVRRGSLPAAYQPQLGGRWQSLRHGRQVLDQRQRVQPPGEYDGRLDPIQERLERRYGPAHVWSASRLETYGSCGMMFFTSSVLDLPQRQAPQPGYDAGQLGSMLHRILELTYLAAPQPISVSGLLEALAPAAEEVFTGAPQVYGFRPTALWEVEQQNLRRVLGETIRSLEATDPQWSPVRFEAAFGLRGTAPLAIETSGGTILLRGLIDRLDSNPRGEVRVIDYKTGSSHMGAADLQKGRRLQLPLYAMAAAQVLDLGVPAEGFYWQLLQAKSSGLKLSRFASELEGVPGAGPQAAIEVASTYAARYASAIRRGQFSPEAPEEGCPQFCPAATWCWRYEPAGW